MLLKNRNGIEVELLSTGGAIRSLLLPDREGRRENVVLTADTYPNSKYLGAFVGRFCNRLKGASFPLNGTVYHVTANEGPNCLHGGRGLDGKAWTLDKRGDNTVRLHCFSPDGEDGFPGNLTVQVDVTLTEDDALILDYAAVSDRDTVVNLTNHSYWNLSGSDDILKHELCMDADHYLEVDGELIPTGRLEPVADTEFDFRTRRPIRSSRYDHCYVLNPGSGAKAELYDPESGRGFRMETDQPGLQLYVGGGLGGGVSAEGKPYGPCAGLCLETQGLPDAPNHPEFPSTLLKAGEIFHSRTVYRFYVNCRK